MKNKDMNLCSTSLTMGKMQVKTMMRYYYTPFRTGALLSAGDNTEQCIRSYSDGGVAKWDGHFGKHLGNFFKVLHTLNTHHLTQQSQSKEMKDYIHTKTCMNESSRFTYNCQKLESTQMFFNG